MHAALHNSLSAPCVLQHHRSLAAPSRHPVLTQGNPRHCHSLLCIKSTASRQGEVLHPEIGKVVFSAQDIEQTVTRLGRQIAIDYQGKNLLVLGVLKGAFMFTADLVRHIEPCPQHFKVDFFKASSYGSGTQSSGQVRLDSAFNLCSVRGKDVLLVEDIIDSGNTLSKLVEVMRGAEAASVAVCTLLDKKERRVVDITPEYSGLQCPNEFIVGYGIDYAERYRHLPYIGVPKPEYIR